MSVLTGGEAIVETVLAHGVDTVFGLPGAQIYGLFDALQRAQPRLKVCDLRVRIVPEELVIHDLVRPCAPNRERVAHHGPLRLAEQAENLA